MTLAILGPTLAFVGLFVVAFLTRWRELEKARNERITAAYAKLLDAAATANSPRAGLLSQKRDAGDALTPEEDKFLDDINARFSGAHTNVLIHGSKEVVAALSRFYDAVPKGIGPELRDSYIALIKAMRDESEADDYDDFADHADNILVTGPDRRRAAQRPQPKFTGGVTFNPPGRPPTATPDEPS